MRHRDFVRTLQRLRPSIIDYHEIFNKFRAVTFTNSTRVTSQPIITGGKAGGNINFNLETKSGEGEINIELPAGFEVNMPIVRAGEHEYRFPIEIDCALTEQNEVMFKPIFADKENVLDQMIHDEVKWFKEQVSKLSDILILMDF